MQAVNKTAGKILDQLQAKAEAEGHAKLDNAPNAFMALTVDLLGGRQMAIGHYFEQGGDLVPDPDMTFWCGPDGRWYPVQITQQWGAQQVVTFGRDGQPERVDPRAQRELAVFAGQWLRNIKRQQFR